MGGGGGGGGGAGSRGDERGVGPLVPEMQVNGRRNPHSFGSAIPLLSCNSLSPTKKKGSDFMGIQLLLVVLFLGGQFLFSP